jgi:hypothetical protein
MAPGMGNTYGPAVGNTFGPGLGNTYGPTMGNTFGPGWGILLAFDTKSVLKYFPCYELCGEDIAVKSAEYFRALRKKGVTVRKTIDGIIATYCIKNRFQLLHNDKDFDQYEKYFGLQTVKKRGV